MAIIIDIDHEGGDLTEYTSTVEDSGDLSAHADAALAGTDYGLKLVIDDTTGIYGLVSFGSPYSTTGIVRARFYIDPNALTMANGNNFRLLVVNNSTPAAVAEVRLGYTTGTGHTIAAMIVDDAAAESFTTYYGISDELHYVEMLLTRASGESTNDGSIQLWIDRVDKETVGSKDNYTRFNTLRIVQFGAVSGIDTGTSGTFYLDQLVVNDDGSEIGPLETGTDLVVADAYVTSQVDAVTTTKNTSLVVADAYVTSQVDAVTTTKNANLVGLADAYVTSQVDAVTTTKDADLVGVADGYVTSQVDGVTVTLAPRARVTWIQFEIPPAVSSSLTVQDAYVTTQADAVTTTKNTSLTVQDAYCTTQADGVTTTKNSSLVVADGYVTTQVDAVVVEEKLPWTRADTLTVNTGSINAGSLRSVWVADDAELVLNEVTGTPGFDYVFRFGRDQDVPYTGIKVMFEAWYEGNPAHNVKLQQYNYNSTSWTDVTGDAQDFPDAASEQTYSFNLIDDPDYLSSGEIQLKIVHTSPGSAGHYLHIDNMYLADAVPSLTVADGYVTSQVDAVTLTQVHNLTVQDAYCTTQVDAIAISGAGTLAVNDAYVTTQADAVTVTIESTLTVADAYVTTQVDGVTTTKSDTLAVGDAYVVTQADSVTLTQVHALTVQDGYCTTQVDTVTLSIGQIPGCVTAADTTIYTVTAGDTTIYTVTAGDTTIYTVTAADVACTGA